MIKKTRKDILLVKVSAVLAIGYVGTANSKDYSEFYKHAQRSGQALYLSSEAKLDEYRTKYVFNRMMATHELHKLNAPTTVKDKQNVDIATGLELGKAYGVAIGVGNATDKDRVVEAVIKSFKKECDA